MQLSREDLRVANQMINEYDECMKTIEYLRIDALRLVSVDPISMDGRYERDLRLPSTDNDYLIELYGRRATNIQHDLQEKYDIEVK